MNLSEQLNYEIMDMVSSIYNLGCWIDDMHRVPPHGIVYRLNCYVYNIKDISSDDMLRAEQASSIVKEHVRTHSSFYPIINVVYKTELVSKEALLNGFRVMWENS